MRCLRGLHMSQACSLSYVNLHIYIYTYIFFLCDGSDCSLSLSLSLYLFCFCTLTLSIFFVSCCLPPPVACPSGHPGPRYCQCYLVSTIEGTDHPGSRYCQCLQVTSMHGTLALSPSATAPAPVAPSCAARPGNS